jgi:uncharacterized membrane protein
MTTLTFRSMTLAASFTALIAASASACFFSAGRNKTEWQFGLYSNGEWCESGVGKVCAVKLRLHKIDEDVPKR